MAGKALLEMVPEFVMKESEEKPKILLVDDREENNYAMKTMMSHLNAEIFTVNSANDALSLMLRHEFAIVITDVKMPDIDGYELVKLMRENPDTVSTPVIFVSGIHIKEDEIRKGYNVGAIDYLIKPIDKAMLIAKVEMFLMLYRQISCLEKAIFYYKKFMDAYKHNPDDLGESRKGDIDKADEPLDPPERVPKILVVDDKDANLYAMKTILKKLPVEIVLANSGAKALEQIHEHNFAAVLLDVQMPEMDGFEAAEKIRAIDKKYLIPIIFVTAINKDKEHVFRGYESGAIDYLLKPINPSILLAKVMMFTQIHQHRVQLEGLLNEKEGLLYQIKKQNKELGFLAYHDPLTHCYNRSGFETNLEKRLDGAIRYKRKFALLFIDLDHFKSINDVYGHEYGDMVLKEVATRLKQTVRASDCVCRIGGDEFAVIIDEISEVYDAGSAAVNILEVLSKSIVADSKEFRIEASIGISCFPIEGEEHTKVTTKHLVRNADVAMYRAKKKRSNTFEYYTQEYSQQHQIRLMLETNLKFALERKEFFLVYQPKIDMQTGKVFGVEALIRWQHPEHGLISPGVFIPIAEETQMIIPIGRWIISEAVRQIKEWKKQFGIDLKVAINISTYQLLDTAFIENIKSVITDNDIGTSCIEFELTETSLMEEFNLSSRVLLDLTDMGFELSIDDFGKGYSMLTYLKKLPIQTLKIDQEFIRDLIENDSSTVIVKTIIDLANNFGLKLIAEGVETQRQADYLIENGCRYAQGYHYSKPLKPDNLIEYVKKSNDSSSTS